MFVVPVSLLYVVAGVVVPAKYVYIKPPANGRFVPVMKKRGFSQGDTFGAGRAWAASILYNKHARKLFDEIYERLVTLNVCNGFQTTTQLNWYTPGLSEEEQPKLIQNESGHFYSGYPTVKFPISNSILLKGMTHSELGVWVAHGEGRFSASEKITAELIRSKQIALHYVDDWGLATKEAPFNPAGSPLGIAGITDPSGKHLGMMPHPERCFLWHQLPWLSENLGKVWTKNFQVAPLFKIFMNAREYCEGKE